MKHAEYKNIVRGVLIPDAVKKNLKAILYQINNRQLKLFLTKVLFSDTINSKNCPVQLNGELICEI